MEVEGNCSNEEEDTTPVCYRNNIPNSIEEHISLESLLLSPIIKVDPSLPDSRLRIPHIATEKSSFVKPDAQSSVFGTRPESKMVSPSTVHLNTEDIDMKIPIDIVGSTKVTEIYLDVRLFEKSIF